MSHQEYLVEQAEVLLSYEPPFALIPIKLTVNDDGKLEKMPVMKWKDKPIPEKELMKKLRAKRGANGLAFDLRRSGLVIIDVDGYKDECNWADWLIDTGYDMPDTWKVKSGSGGHHYIFANPDNIQLRGNIAGVAAVDIKSAGIEIIPPSFIDGYQYDWLTGPDELEDGPAPIPDWLIEECGKGEASGSGADNVTVALAMREPEENLDVLDKLLAAPNDGVDYAQWLTIVMGLHFEFHETSFELMARTALVDWTKTRAEGCSDDDIEQVKKTWDSLPRMAEIQTPFVTIGSVYHFLDQFEKAPMTPDKAAELKDAVKEVTAPRNRKLPSVYTFTGETMPPRPWVMGTDLIKGEVSALFAKGGTGKSSLVILQALAIATGRPLLGVKVYGKRKVWLWNGEDGIEELQRRIVAAMMHYGITQEDIGDRLMLQTSADMPVNIAFETTAQDRGKDRQKVSIDSVMIDWIVDTANDTGAEVLMFDPFVNTHQLNENDNVHVNVVMQAFKKIAQDGNVAVQLVHHVAKGTLRSDGKEDTSEAARGATSFINAARVGLALQQVSIADAGKVGEGENENDFVKLVDSKANLAQRRSMHNARWFKKVSVKLNNGTELYPEGDYVAVMEIFQPTEKMLSSHYGQLLTIMQTLEAELAEHERTIDDDEEETGGYIFKNTANSFWAGWKIAEVLNLPIGEHGSEDKRSDRENANRLHILELLNEAISLRYVANTEQRLKPANGKPAPIYTVTAGSINLVLSHLNS